MNNKVNIPVLRRRYSNYRMLLVSGLNRKHAGAESCYCQQIPGGTIAVAYGYINFTRQDYLLKITLLVFVIFLFGLNTGMAQDITAQQYGVPIKDLKDVIRSALKKPVAVSSKEEVTVTMLPSIGYNPSFGYILGAKASIGKQLGDPVNTIYSVVGLEAIASSKGTLILQVRHSIYLPDNKWNFQGHWQVSKFAQVDYGIGSGKGNKTPDFIVDGIPVTNSDSAYPITYSYTRFMQKVFRRVGHYGYAGAGISFDIRKNINDEKFDDLGSTPHSRYSERNNYSTTSYSANGLLLMLQYNRREHPIQSYGGMYFDMGMRFNQTWLGSTKNSVQFTYDFRKYWSLSKRRPDHVIALWHWASYLLNGTLPYLEMPATGYDTYARSGRGYTIGRFKGPSYACVEGEYRFPILSNWLLSGVAFCNLQTASTDTGLKVFESWQGAYGAGLRVLFSKASRSRLCIDYAKGNYGSQGLFFGLNEIF